MITECSVQRRNHTIAQRSGISGWKLSDEISECEKSDCKDIFLHSNIKKPARELMWLWRRRSIIIDDEKAHECVVVVCQTCLQVFFLHLCVVKIMIVIRVSSWTTVVFSNKNKQVTVYVENYGMSRVFYVLLKIVIANCCTLLLRWISCTWCEQTDSSL